MRISINYKKHLADFNASVPPEQRLSVRDLARIAYKGGRKVTDKTAAENLARWSAGSQITSCNPYHIARISRALNVPIEKLILIK